MKQIAIRCVCAYLCVIASVDAHRRVKRIIGGSDLPDHNLYNTQFAISLQQTFRCVSDQFDHRLADCRNNNVCGGSLITADFVLTACHCLAFELWYAKPPPHRKDLLPGDIPPYLDDRINHRPREKGDPLVYRNTVTVEHPLHTTLTLFAGHPDKRKAPQRRHSAKFFVHHLCAANEVKKQPELWEDVYYELDVGLIKACFPFNLNSEVKVAPIFPFGELDNQLHRLIAKSYTCLIIGWGLSLKPILEWTVEDIIQGFGTVVPNILQHMFRYIQCNRDCTFDTHACLICSRHHGSTLAATRIGDSGSPLICDGYFLAVHARGLEVKGWIERNYTIAMHVPVACVRHYIGEDHLSYLRSLTHDPFHYIDGSPVPGQ